MDIILPDVVGSIGTVYRTDHFYTILLDQALIIYLILRSAPEIIVQADGTTDESEEVVKEFPNVLYLNNHQRGGKSAALNEAYKVAKGEILIFSDSNALLNETALSELVNAFNNPKVEVARGEKVGFKKHIIEMRLE